MENISVQVENVSKIFKLHKPRGILNLIRMRSLLKHAKPFLALDGISFTVKQGEVLGIIGLNGSGKTTLLRILAGVYSPNSGTVKINGRLSPLLQIGTGFESDLEARDNIIMNGMLLGVTKSYIESKVDEIISYAELENFKNLQLKHYSSGMRGRLGFAIAMHLDPDILLVDEILSVGDKDFSKKCLDSFLSFKKAKKTIIHTTHNLEMIENFCDRVLLLHKGKIVMIGNPSEAIQKYVDLHGNS